MQTLQNYKKLTEMIPELEELVDTGIATPTTTDFSYHKTSIQYIDNIYNLQ